MRMIGLSNEDITRQCVENVESIRISLMYATTYNDSYSEHSSKKLVQKCISTKIYEPSGDWPFLPRLCPGGSTIDRGINHQ